jgi:endo-1,4-beta-xylanase
LAGIGLGRSLWAQIKGIASWIAQEACAFRRGSRHITEFDINTPDETLQADYLRDFLLALYSHPAASGFTMWGFWENKHWKPDAALLRADWSEKPAARVWRELVCDTWRTKLDAKTDANGIVDARGHLGTYEFLVTTPRGKLRQRRVLAKTGLSAILQDPTPVA